MKIKEAKYEKGKRKKKHLAKKRKLPSTHVVKKDQKRNKEKNDRCKIEGFLLEVRKRKRYGSKRDIPIVTHEESPYCQYDQVSPQQQTRKKTPRIG